MEIFGALIWFVFFAGYCWAMGRLFNWMVPGRVIA